MLSYRLKEYLASIFLFRVCISILYLFRGKLRLYFTKSKYDGLSDICWLYRVSDIAFFKKIARNYINNIVSKVKKGGRNPFINAFHLSASFIKCKNKYSIESNEKQNILRDIIILKQASTNEKGVILLKYTETFEAFIALFDTDRIFEKYYIVLEPSWAGYCDPSILMYISNKHDVVIQSFTEDDYVFITDLNINLKPIKLGPSDWVDLDQFNMLNMEKVYDLIMIANWAYHKKHVELLKALHNLDRKLYVLLVGFEWGGRKKEDIEKEIIKRKIKSVQIDIVENLSHAEIVIALNKSKVKVFLTKKEGDNKAVVEALFCNVPILVYENTIGGAKNKVNKATGMFTSYAELSDNIDYMVSNYTKFSPREWAKKNTGYLITTRRLNHFIKDIAKANGETYSNDIEPKINSPNLLYKNEEIRPKFRVDYDFIKSQFNFGRANSDQG
jgi:hypothetical protein